MRSRQGVAATEFAVCLPLIVLLLLGSIEASTMIFLKQTLTIAAYEGARHATAELCAESDVEETCHSVLDDRNVAGASVSVSPGPLEVQPEQTWITVTVTAPAADNSVIQGMFMDGRIVTARATMMKKY